MTYYVTLSQRLNQDLSALIATTSPGGKLPTEPKLAKQLGVSRTTLREAMRSFEAQGLISRHQGKGTFVLRPSHVIETGLEILESIETLTRRIGLQVTLGELKVEHGKPSEDEERALEIAPGMLVDHVSRIIVAENRPVAYLVDILPAGILSADDLPENFRGSVLDLLLKRGDPPLINSHCEIGAVDASHDIARALNIQRGDALLRFVSRLYAVDGRIVDYSFSYFLPGYFRFHVVRRIGSV